MSILIKGEAMPKSCGECPCICLNWSFIGCAITASRTDDVDLRLPDCPLVEIPPHGRLIDADEFEDELYEHEFSNWCDKDEVSELIDSAPTVIESEEQEHGHE